MAPTPPVPELRIGLLLFDDVEVLDAGGPFEVFSVAARITSPDRPSGPPRIGTVTLAAGPTTTVRARGGLPMVADRLLAAAPAVDLAVVPGGVTERVERDPAVLAWVRRAAASGAVVVSVCT